MVLDGSLGLDLDIGTSLQGQGEHTAVVGNRMETFETVETVLLWTSQQTKGWLYQGG